MKLQITIHVFGYGPDGTERHDEVWTNTLEPEVTGSRGVNPPMLRADIYGETSISIFSLERIEGDTAYYFPFATHLKLPFLERLPKYGWERTAQ